MTRCCILHCSGGYHSKGTPGHCKKAKECCAKLTKKQMQEAQAQYNRRCKEVCNEHVEVEEEEHVEEAAAPALSSNGTFMAHSSKAASGYFKYNYGGGHLGRVCYRCIRRIRGFCYRDSVTDLCYCQTCVKERPAINMKLVQLPDFGKRL